MSTDSPEVTSFAELSLSPASLKALKGAHFERPTPIQARAIPPALQGKDVIGIAATGTGKTAAFLLPILERLAGKPGTRALVLAPTRELALQIGEELERFGDGRGVRGAVVIGGVGMGQQSSELAAHQVVIATPGRLVDHLQQGSAKLDRVEVLVLDEADRMLDMGFMPQLTKILAQRPARPADAALLRHHGRRGGRVRPGAPQGSGPGRGGAQRHHRRPRRAAGLPGVAGGEAPAAPLAARRGRALHAGLHPHQAARRPRREGRSSAPATR